jgi:L-alanine-DL-glutamate epimerase-like enolase superfamily enzyme
MHEQAVTRALAPRVQAVEVRRLEVPLTTPYHLAFGDVHAFDTVLVRLIGADGREGWGEATVLTGYTDETIDGCWTLARELAREAAGATVERILAAAARAAEDAPFTATAFASAAEMLRGAATLERGTVRRVPLLGTLNETDARRMPAAIELLLAHGYRTLKIKVGLAPDADAARIRNAQRLVAGRARLRVDANQGFSAAQARAFAHAVEPQGIELFEQPCKAGDWDAHAAVAADCPLPLMLDESIYDERDIDRAAETRAAAYVKVKLMKLGTLERLAAALGRIEAQGMRAVLGNGVATDFGCWMEACVAADCIGTAGEMNGFLKQRRPLVTNPVRVEEGAMVLPAAYRPLPDWEAIDACTVDRIEATP